MSLSSQLRDPGRPVRRFFLEFEDKKELRKCLVELQSSKPLQQPIYQASEVFVHSVIGTTIDYLIRYVGFNNSLDFENITALKRLHKWQEQPTVFVKLLSIFKIGKKRLDGRLATSEEAIYSATALSVLEAYYRSGELPEEFNKIISIENNAEKNFCEKEVTNCFDRYLCRLGGDQYISNVKSVIELFLNELSNPKSEIYNCRFVIHNQTLGNAVLVGGADIDCVIERNNKFILTDIKTSIKPLRLMSLRQLISYALLYDEKKDNFSFTEIGFYHSYSGSFRSLVLTEVIKNTFPRLNSIDDIRSRFIEKIKNFDYYDEIINNSIKRTRIRKPVKVGDTVTFCFIDSESDNHTVEIVDTDSKLKNGVINEKELLAQVLLGVSIGGNTNIEIKGLGIRTIKVLKIKSGKPSVKKKKTNNVSDREISEVAQKNNEKREKTSEFEFIDQLISLMKVIPKTKQS